MNETPRSFLIMILRFTAAAIFAAVITISQLIHPLFAATTNTLNAGVVLNPSDHLVSANGLFVLGFMNRSYLGIWFNSSVYNPRGHPVWVASRNQPLFQNPGALTVDATGKLEILQDGREPVEIYSGNGSPTRGNASAVLEDSGNLVVKAKGSGFGEEEVVLWQSFDHPTDTLLPGMKLGFSNRTGMEKRWKLTSWLAEGNPAPGAFTLEWDYNARQLLVKMRESVFWRSGVLDAASGKFPATRFTAEVNKNFNFTTVSEPGEESFSYEFYDVGLDPRRSNESQWVMGYQGTIVDARTLIMVLYFENCDGTRNEENGCERWESGPTCSRRLGDRMELRAARYSPAQLTLNSNRSLSFADCRELCWRNCSCNGALASGLGNWNSTGCIFYEGPLSFQDLRGNEQQLFAIIPAPPPPKPSKTWIWIIVAATASLLITVAGFLLYKRWRRQKFQEKFLKDLMTLDRPSSDATPHEDNGNSKGDNSLQVYTILSIINATNSFSLDNKLGEGGFGPVYRGRLKEGQEVAVKRLSRRSGQGLVEFKNELILIAKLQHTNLVRLLGFCVQGEERMLVYEYMPNKSLDSFIFDDLKRKLLDWKARFNIIEGIAQGLLYLHKYSRVRIIHRDLKVIHK